MYYCHPLATAKLVTRYKRFFADLILDDGQKITAHCPNTGSMMGLNESGIAVRFSTNNDPKRKLKYTLEQVNPGSGWVGVNTNLPNKIVKEALEQKKIPELLAYDIIKTEQKYGENSRIDILLENSQTGERCYVEIKNVTLKLSERTAAFPDAVTSRGSKHLHELAQVVKKGEKACIFYLINRTDCDKVTCAKQIDPIYAQNFTQALAAGVDAIAYNVKLTDSEIVLDQKVEVIYG